jgi:hypothetical protein
MAQVMVEDLEQNTPVCCSPNKQQTPLSVASAAEKWLKPSFSMDRVAP